MSVVVVGSCNLDLIVEVESLPIPGQTVLGSDVIVRAGGKGANQAVAASRLGADVTFVGAVGTDDFGTTLCEMLGAEIELRRVRRVAGPTGVALILVERAGENVISVAPGANRQVGATDLDAVAPAFDGDTVLLTQLEIPVATCVAAAERVRSVGGVVLTNAAPLADGSDADVRRLVGFTDVLIVNETEASALAGIPAPTSAMDGWTVLAADLRRWGPETVIVTLGAEGAAVADVTGAYIVPPERVRAVDTTGAGDAFCGALAASLDAGLPMDLAVRRAGRAGALATTAVGAQEALPRVAALEEFEGATP